MFARELRDGEARTSPQMQLLLQVLGHFSPQRMLNRQNANDPNFEEVVIPARMATFSVDLSGLAALLKPNQDMANAISLELARGRDKVPAFTLLIYRRLAEPPRSVATKEHSAAIAKWRGNARQAKREAFPLAVPIQAWMLYQLRFLLTAELIGALSTFGGLAAGLSHLPIVLNIATVDTIAVGLAYGRMVKQHLEEMATSRAESTVEAGYFASFLSSGNAAFRLKAAAESDTRPVAPTAAHPDVPKNPPPADNPPPRTNRRWNRRQPTSAAASSASSPPRRRSARRSRSPKRRTPARRYFPQRKPPPTKQKKKR